MEKEQEKQIIRQYLNGIYSSQEVKKITESLHHADELGILEDLAAEVWEEAEACSNVPDLNKKQERKKQQFCLRNYSHETIIHG